MVLMIHNNTISYTVTYTADEGAVKHVDPMKQTDRQENGHTYHANKSITEGLELDM